MIIDKNNYFELLASDQQAKNIDVVYARVFSLVGENPKLQFLGDLEPTDTLFPSIGVRDTYTIGDTVAVLQINTRRFLLGAIRNV